MAQVLFLLDRPAPGDLDRVGGNFVECSEKGRQIPNMWSGEALTEPREGAGMGAWPGAQRPLQDLCPRCPLDHQCPPRV